MGLLKFSKQTKNKFKDYICLRIIHIIDQVSQLAILLHLKTPVDNLTPSNEFEVSKCLSRLHLGTTLKGAKMLGQTSLYFRALQGHKLEDSSLRETLYLDLKLLKRLSFS